MKKLYLATLIIAVLGFVALPSIADANLLGNPDFETAGIGGDQDADIWVESDDARREGWPDFAERPTGSWGIGVMDWGGNKNGEAYQDVTSGITGSTPYNFTIWAKRDGGEVVGDYYMTLAWYQDGIYIADNSQNISLTDSWVKHTLTGTSPGNANKVQVLFGQDADQCGKWDDASLDAVPEPASMLLLGSGLLGLFGIGRKKRS
ncbi:MAG: PEP-CTERM sorting domain-containing protein [Candidatus Omnitrophica bacterium]|nr:PEP-CTERM sorting domain-containing protein [Candidatus Omnitrophota bacterium]